jgi:hypothetical protein
MKTAIFLFITVRTSDSSCLLVSVFLHPRWTNNIHDLFNDADAVGISDYEASMILSKEQEMIPARKAIDAHVQDFVTSEELEISILNAFAEHSQTARYFIETVHIFSLCVLIEESVASTNRIASIVSSPPHSARHTHLSVG